MSISRVSLAENNYFNKSILGKELPSFSAQKPQQELLNKSFNELSNYYHPVSIYKTQPSIPSNDDELEKIKEKYAKKIFEFTIQTKLDINPETTYCFGKLINDCNKELLAYAKRHNLSYIDVLDISTKNLEKAIKDINKTNKAIKDSCVDISKITIKPCFKSSSIEFRNLTAEEKTKAHLNIHFSSALCAGISAFVGEGCMVGADIPLLCCVETNMFYKLGEMLNVPLSASMMHGVKHMFSAGMLGGALLKWLNTTASNAGHIATLFGSFGFGNAAITAYLRTSNAFLSALLCEHMGWAYVRDYQKGKMNTEDKFAETMAYTVFMVMTYGFGHMLDIEKPAEILQENIAKQLGISFAQNASKENMEFIKAAMEFLSYSPITKAAKGIEIITPAIAAHLVENNGKLDEDFVLNVIKGSIFSLVCSDLFGEIVDGEIFKEKAKKLILFMKEDPQINELIKLHLKTKGITNLGKVVLGEPTVKNLQTVYNDVVPLIVNLLKDMKAV